MAKKEMTRKAKKLKAWKAFARYIKARDADKCGICYCITCSKQYRYDDPYCQAGHFVPGRGNAILFDEDVVFAQCAYCNRNGGELYLYTLALQRRGLTDEEIAALNNRRHRVVKYTEDDLLRIADEFNHRADAIIALKKI